jgi:hypothetical protein
MAAVAEATTVGVALHRTEGTAEEVALHRTEGTAEEVALLPTVVEAVIQAAVVALTPAEGAADIRAEACPTAVVVGSTAAVVAGAAVVAAMVAAVSARRV